MSDLNLSILGFPAANRDLNIELRDPTTQTVTATVRPFLDGTAKFTKIPPGAYEMTVVHPNVALPVIRQPIRVLPVGNTKVTVLLDPSKFRNTPIEDIPEANLGPVSDQTRSIAETVTPLASKAPGEVILAQDWNAMVSAVRDLSNVVGQMLGLVSPVGHNHPELESKINEMSDNFQQLLQTLSASLAELQREVQLDQLDRHVGDVLDQAGIDPASAQGKEMTDIVSNLKLRTTDTPTLFAQAVRNAGVQLDTKVNALLDAKANDPSFATSDAVKNLSLVVDAAKSQRSTTYGAELDKQRATQRILNANLIAR